MVSSKWLWPCVEALAVLDSSPLAWRYAPSQSCPECPSCVFVWCQDAGCTPRTCGIQHVCREFHTAMCLLPVSCVQIEAGTRASRMRQPLDQEVVALAFDDAEPKVG